MSHSPHVCQRIWCQRIWLPAIRALVASAGVVLLSSPFAMAQAATKIGVVDIVKAVEQYPLYIKLRGEHDETAHGFETELKQIEKAADEARGALLVMSEEDSPDRKDREFQLQMLLAQHDYRRKAFRERLAFEETRSLVRVYADLEVAIAKVAKQRGVHLVLRKHVIEPASGSVEQMTPRELDLRMKLFERQSVWFADDALDLTGDVIKLMQVPVAPDKPKAADGQTPPAPPRGGD